MGDAEAGAERGVGPGAPGDGADEGALPHGLTFFLSAAERRAVLRVLKTIDGDRARALLRALGIETD